MDLENNIFELRDIIIDLEKRVMMCDRSLDPIRRTIDEIKASIRTTHAPGCFNPDRAEERVPLFARLLYIAENHGRAFSERTMLHQRSKAYQRELDRIMRDIERAKKKKAKQDNGQGSLFE